jgi:hypothetical protein
VLNRKQTDGGTEMTNEEKIKAHEKEAFDALKIDIQEIIEMIKVEDAELADYIQKNMVFDEQNFTLKYVGDRSLNEWMLQSLLSTPNKLMAFAKKLILMFN